MYSVRKNKLVTFLSTLPARGATCFVNPMCPSPSFLSTLPARGATDTISRHGVAYKKISIHAPREGSDRQGVRPFQPVFHFYPRSPRGERRQAYGSSCTCRRTFLSTLPARGATRAEHQGRPDRRISIHAPREGSDRREAGRRGALVTFLSTLPARGATYPYSRKPAQRQNFYPRSPRGERLV